MKEERIQLGTIPDVTADTRDAVHVAILPAVADTQLYPGQRVGIVRQQGLTYRVGPVGEQVGIVDPFLTHPIPEGGTFWLVLMPNTITAMSHHWTHPAIDSATFPLPKPWMPENSEKWLRDWCEQHDTPGYEFVMQAIRGERMEPVDDYYTNPYTISNDSLWFGGRDAHAETTPEFWEHVENVLGHPPKFKPEYFTCGC